MQPRHFRIAIVALLLIQGFLGTSSAQQSRQLQRILIETRRPYDGVVRAIEATGGRVTQQFTYVDGVAADVPEAAVPAIAQLPGVVSIEKDIDVEKPASVDPIRARSAAKPQNRSIATDSPTFLGRIPPADLGSLAANHPEVYSVNNAGTRIERLHALGFTGQGITVAVIDSGIRTGYKLIKDSIVGGIDFVDDGDPGPAGDAASDWKKESNDGHGTVAAGLIAGDGSFSVGGVLKDALQRYAPDALVDGKLSLIGTAPDAQIYVVRVFGDNGAGASIATLLAAIQHVIDQRLLYNNTNGRKGVRIDVANLSGGISTRIAGRTMFERSIDAMLDAGIVPVIASGNAGPSTLTYSSPSSSLSALSVGGSSSAVNERIFNEVLYGTQILDEYYPGIGGDIRPFNGTQTAWFSSRGPTADGRMNPNVVAGAVGIIGQGYCPDQILDACFKRISIVSGTSFASPIVSGIAATLIQAFPGATATQIRNAIILSGRPDQIAGYFDDVDRGHGLPDAFGAYQLLASGTVPDSLPPTATPFDLVEDNVEHNTDLHVVSGSFSKSFVNLKPGERGEILYDVPPDTDRVVVRIGNVQMTGPQNPFFGGDAMFLYVHSAKTSAIHGVGDYLLDPTPVFLGGEPLTKFEFSKPETGIMRITLNPDTQNAGFVGANVSIQAYPESFGPTTTISKTINNGEIKMYTVNVAQGTKRLDFLLSWDHNWAHYPTSDVDLIVCSPDIPATVEACKASGNKQGATVASPERTSIENPAAGNWTVLVNGFDVPTQSGSDNFKLRIKKVN